LLLTNLNYLKYYIPPPGFEAHINFNAVVISVMSYQLTIPTVEARSLKY